MLKHGNHYRWITLFFKYKKRHKKNRTKVTEKTWKFQWIQLLKLGQSGITCPRCCLLSCLSETLPIHERSSSTFSGTVASVLTRGLRNAVTTPRPAGRYTRTACASHVIRA